MACDLPLVVTVILREQQTAALRSHMQEEALPHGQRGISGQEEGSYDVSGRCGDLGPVFPVVRLSVVVGQQLAGEEMKITRSHSLSGLKQEAKPELTRFSPAAPRRRFLPASSRIGASSVCRPAGERSSAPARSTPSLRTERVAATHLCVPLPERVKSDRADHLVVPHLLGTPAVAVCGHTKAGSALDPAHTSAWICWLLSVPNCASVGRLERC